MSLARLPGRALAIAKLAGIFVVDLVKASVAVARIVLAPRIRTRPGILAVPVSLKTRGGVAAFASFVSLTPGSVALHVAEDGRTIYVHVLDIEDAEAEIARFKRDFEDPIARAER